MNLAKGTFSSGYTNISDESKIEFLFSIKAFIAVFSLLKYVGSKTLFDFDIEHAHDQSLTRINQVLKFSDGKLELPYEFTYFILSAFASCLTFVTVKLNIRLSYYFYVLTKNSA